MISAGCCRRPGRRSACRRGFSQDLDKVIDTSGVGCWPGALYRVRIALFQQQLR